MAFLDGDNFCKAFAGAQVKSSETRQITAGVAGRKNPLQITSDLQRVFLPNGLTTIAM